MKIFGYEFRKFEKEITTIEDAVETWTVEWLSMHHYVSNTYRSKTRHQAFMSKESADRFAKELQDARNLLGDKDVYVKVYKQTPPTNAPEDSE